MSPNTSQSTGNPAPVDPSKSSVGKPYTETDATDSPFPKLPSSPDRAETGTVHPNSLIRLRNARKHERDSPKSSNPGRGPAKTARLPGRSNRNTRGLPAITPLRFQPPTPPVNTRAQDPFLSPPIADDLVNSLSTPAVLNLSALETNYVTALPLSRSTSPQTSPARPSFDLPQEEGETDSDIDMSIPDNAEDLPQSIYTPSETSSDDAPPSPTPAPYTISRRYERTIAKAYRLLRDENGILAPVNGIDSKTLWTALDKASNSFWRSQTDSFAMLTLISQSPSVDLDDTKDKIRKVIEYHTGATNPVIAIPTFNDGPIRPLIVSRIPDEAIDILTNQHIWVTAAVAFAAWPSKDFTSQYVLTLLQLDIPVNEVTTAQDVIVSALQDDAYFKTFVSANRDAYPSRWNEDRCLRRALASIRCVGYLLGVRGSEKKTTVFNVYFTPPTNNPSALNKLHRHLRARKFPSIWGTAVARPPYSCSTCLGQDHPTGLCAYPRLQGWPLPAEADQTAPGSPPPPKTRPPRNTNRNQPERDLRRGEGRGPSTNRGRGGRTLGRTHA